VLETSKTAPSTRSVSESKNPRSPVFISGHQNLLLAADEH
jgi:hypothetical protein